MKIESGFQPSCSEAVLRFHTVESAKIQVILQAIADTIGANNDWVKEAETCSVEDIVKENLLYALGSSEDIKKKLAEIPLDKLSIETLEPLMASNQSDRNYSLKKIKRILELRESYPVNSKVPLLKDVKEYEKTYLLNCSGLGDNESIIRVNKRKGYFTLNIGNNDITDGAWIDIVKTMGIWVEEAEFSKALEKIARDCTCGITYFNGYDKLITDENREEAEARRMQEAMALIGNRKPTKKEIEHAKKLEVKARKK
jgi:hypothetical protein